MRQGVDLVPVEVELVLSPGLPRIHVIGLPDAAIKESALRIRTAVRKQGFRLPRGQQILVHLKPNHLRKSSRGLDLAIAAALLWETEQVPRPKDLSRVFLYGELSLTGEVETPDDFSEIPYIESALLYSGASGEACALPRFRLKTLRDLQRPVSLSEPAFELQQAIRPEPLMSSYHPASAALAAVIATGEHSALFAGPSGSGKSTLAASLLGWLEEPQGEEGRRAAERWARATSTPIWRPFVRPHHTITKLAMIGGGANAWSGEISRAHTGVLLMDELLEFDPEIQEALREPIENGVISISRAGRTQVYPARVLLMATTNLCACGRFVPKTKVENPCRCSSIVRKKYLRRLTGPFADRFAIIAYSDTWKSKGEVKRVHAHEIMEQVEKAIRFREKRREQKVANAYLDVAGIEAALSSAVQMELDTVLEGASFRRREAVLRVARTLADLRESAAIEFSDFDKALQMAWEGHKLLEDWRD